MLAERHEPGGAPGGGLAGGAAPGSCLASCAARAAEALSRAELGKVVGGTGGRNATVQGAVEHVRLSRRFLGWATLFSVLGHTITATVIEIRRPLHTIRLSRAELRGARVDSLATRGSIRLFANGGLFSFTGFSRNATLRTYRLYVTNPKRAVVLWFIGRTVVILPDAPAAFVAELGMPDHVA